MQKMRLSDLSSDGACLLPERYAGKTIAHGGVHAFKPGETAHPEEHHTHETDEVFLILQGKGVIPIDGQYVPVQAGDVVIVEPGEDHHATSSPERPMVVAWYVMGR